MANSFSLDAQNNVIGGWAGTLPAPAGHVLCSLEDALTVRDSGRRIAGTDVWRWRYTGGSSVAITGTLTEVVDTRPTGAFSSASQYASVLPGGDVVIDAPLRPAGEVAQVTLTTSATGLNSDRVVVFDGVLPVRASFTAGIAVLSVPLDVSASYVIAQVSEPSARLTNRLHIRVAGPVLLPR